MAAMGQTALNMAQVGYLPYTANLSDVWGWEDSTGTEYALVGAFNGFSVVSLATPSAPVEVAFIPGPNSIWRDIKTYGRFAYVTHDFTSGGATPLGLLIVDLDSAAFGQSADFQYRYMKATNFPGDSMRTAHNLWIDENGVMYLFGGDVGNGGALMYDVTTNPFNPTYLGSYDDVYLHDGFARGDTLYGAAVLAGDFRVVDVSNKSSVVTLGVKTTPSNFCHNVWPSDDSKTLYSTDEVSSGYVAAYDISDLNNITELDKKQTTLGSGVIPHNAHVLGNYIVTSYYTSGVQILDATEPDIMVETGYYDTSPTFSGGGFHGAWGAYPYLSSGLVLATDIEEGLYVLSAEYKQASYLDITVKDSLTGAPLNLSSLQQNGSFLGLTNALGRYKNGSTTSGTFTIRANKGGYKPDSVTVTYTPGQRNTIVFSLLPIGFGTEDAAFAEAVLYPNPGTTTAFLGNVPSEVLAVTAVSMSGATTPLFVEQAGRGLALQTAELQAGVYIFRIETAQGTFFRRWVKLP